MVTPGKAKSVKPKPTRQSGRQTSRKKPEAAKPEPTAFRLPIRDRRLLLPQKVCSLVFSVSPQAIQQWPVEPREKQGRVALYYLPDLMTYRETQNDKQDSNLNAARARLAIAQAERAELELKERIGELIPADVILSNWQPLVGAARAKVLSIPSKAKTRIPKLSEKDLAKLKAICRGVLEDLANGGLPRGIKHDSRPGA